MKLADHLLAELAMCEGCGRRVADCDSDMEARTSTCSLRRMVAAGADTLKPLGKRPCPQCRQLIHFVPSAWTSARMVPAYHTFAGAFCLGRKGDNAQD